MRGNAVKKILLPLKDILGIPLLRERLDKGILEFSCKKNNDLEEFLSIRAIFLYSLYYLMILVIGNAIIWVMPGTFLLNFVSKFS